MSQSTTLEMVIKAKGDFDQTFQALIGQMKASESATESARQKVSGLSGEWEKAKSAFSSGLGFGAAFSLGEKAADLLVGAIKAIPEAIFDAASAAVKLASDLEDTSASTGIAVEALQRLSFAGAPTGTSLESMTSAIVKMNQRLSESPESFAKWGLSAQVLRQMDPADALTAISEKLRALPDQAAQTAAAMDMLGKGGGAALKFLKSDIADLSYEAGRLGAVLDEETVKSLDALDDAVAINEKAWNGLKLQIGAIIAGNPEFLEGVKSITEAIGALSVMVRDNKGFLKDYLSDLMTVAHLLPGVTQFGQMVQLAGTLGDSSPRVKPGQGLDFDPGPQIDFNKILNEGLAIAEKLAVAHEKAGKAAAAAAERAAKPMRDWVSKVNDLAAALKVAERNNAPLDVVTKEYGRSIEEVIRQGQILGRELPASIERTANAMRNAKLDAIIAAQMQGVRKEVESGADAMRKTIDKLHDDNAKKLGAIFKTEADDEKLAVQEAQNHRAAVLELGDAIGRLGDTVGGSFGTLLNLGSSAITMFDNLGHQAQTGAEKIRAVAGAIDAIGQAYQSKSILGGAAKGAAAGAQFGWIGAVVGGVVGAFAGQAGRDKQQREQAAAAAKMKTDLLDLYGGWYNLERVADRAGVSMAAAFGAKGIASTPAEIQATIEALDKAMEAHEKRIQAVQSAMAALALRAKGFADQMARGGEASERTQAAFDRLGQYALVTFAAYVRETGDAIGAIMQMGDALDQLAQLQAEFGFTASATLASLLGLRDVISANQDVADSISGLNQLMTSLGAAGYQSAALFAAFGQDAADLFQTLIDRGVGANQAMALMAPTLQSLWEHQQRFHDITDEATLALLHQAEEQGVVGDAMRDVNEQILLVLLAIGEALGATIPEALRNLDRAATEHLGNVANAADGAANSIGNIPTGGGGTSGPPGRGPRGPGAPGGDYSGYAMGGTVPWTPGGRVVRVAEQSTEHIVSSAQLAEIIGRAGALNGGSYQGGGQMINLTVPVYIGGEQLDAVINRRIAAGYIARPD